MDDTQVDGRLRKLSFGPSGNVRHFKGYYVNDYRFRVRAVDIDRVTAHSGLWVKGSVYEGEKMDYYGTLVDIVELHYGLNSVVLFRADWYDNCNSVRVVLPHGLIEVCHTSGLHSPDVYVLAQQAHQVYNMSYPSPLPDREDWMVACKVRVRRSFNVSPIDYSVSGQVLQDDGDAVSRPGPILEIGCPRAVPHVFDEVDSDELNAAEQATDEHEISSEEDECGISEEY